MAKTWWKILAVVLMIYVIIAGFLMPLKPGILSANPQNFKTGESVELSVNTYNAELNQIDPSSIRSWLLSDTSYTIAAKKVEVKNQSSVQLSFDIPELLPSEDSLVTFSLVIDGPKMGAFVLPSAIFIRQDSINIESGIALWSKGNFGDINKTERLSIPFRPIIYETIRNTYFHVSLWFAMFILYFVAVIYSINYLSKKNAFLDNVSSSLVEVGTLFGILGLITGAIWAKNTWGTYWTTDVKLNMAAVSMMIYAAYLVLRVSIADQDKRAVISSSYNIFAFFIIIPLIFVIPRLTDSLHPGNGGNPGLGGEDLDNTMRMVFYPSIIAFTLIGTWMSNLMIRFKKIRSKINEN